MRQVVRFGLFGIAGAVLVVLTIVGLAPSPSAEEGTKPRSVGDVILLRCNAAGADLAVSTLQGSSGTPSKKPGNCAENLALLLKDGFSIRDIGHYHQGNFVLYTLLR